MKTGPCVNRVFRRRKLGAAACPGSPDTVSIAHDVSFRLIVLPSAGQHISQELASYLKIANVFVDTVCKVCEVAGEW